MNLIFLLKILKISSVINSLGRKNLRLRIFQNFKKREKRPSLKLRVFKLIKFFKAKNQMKCMLFEQLKREKKKLI